MQQALTTTNLPLQGKRTGKVRDLYDLPLPDGSEGLLIVTTDRVSVFDVVLANGIPGRGQLLTQISKFWLERLNCPHHLLSTDPQDIPGLSAEQRQALEGRCMLCQKTEVAPIECIVRGYLTGSGFKDYQQTGEVCGIPLPPGLVNSSRIDEPIFTPSTKAETGHDQNISFAEAAELVGPAVMEQLRDLSLSLYAKGRDHALERGIIIADTKFEFGWNAQRELLLIDEALTPDSSRFWPADEWRPGQEQNSFDKQIVRNYAEGLVQTGKWNKEPPGPALPDEVIQRTQARYQEALDRLMQ